VSIPPYSCLLLHAISGSPLRARSFFTPVNSGIDIKARHSLAIPFLVSTADAFKSIPAGVKRGSNPPKTKDQRNHFLLPSPATSPGIKTLETEHIWSTRPPHSHDAHIAMPCHKATHIPNGPDRRPRTHHGLAVRHPPRNPSLRQEHTPARRRQAHDVSRETGSPCQRRPSAIPDVQGQEGCHRLSRQGTQGPDSSGTLLRPRIQLWQEESGLQGQDGQDRRRAWV